MSRRGWVLFAAMCVVWGIPYLMIKVAVTGVSTPVLVFARTAIGAMVLLPAAARRGGLGVLGSRWRPLVAFAVVEIMGPWFLLSNAERRLPSSLTGLLIAATPVVGVVIARLTGGAERLSAKRWTGLAVGFAGVVVLAAPQLGGGNGWSLTEMLLVILGYATAPLIAARKLGDVPSLQLTAACLTLAALVYAPAALASWPHALPSTGVLASLGGLGVVCTAGAFIVFFELIREVGPSKALVFTYVNPAVAVAAGVALLGEPLSAAVLASFVLILAGSVLATAPAARQAAADSSPVAGAGAASGAGSGSGSASGCGSGAGSDPAPGSRSLPAPDDRASRT